MTGYNPKSQKIHAEKDGKQENKKKWKWKRFPKPDKRVGEKLWSIFLDSFFTAADPEVLSCTGQFINKEVGTRLKLVLKPNVWL